MGRAHGAIRRTRALFPSPVVHLHQDVMELHLASNWCLPGVGDTGAHLSVIIDAGWPTFVLSHWHRDTGFYSLQEAVRRLTSAPAVTAVSARSWSRLAGCRDPSAAWDDVPRVVGDRAAPRAALRVARLNLRCTTRHGHFHLCKPRTCIGLDPK